MSPSDSIRPEGRWAGRGPLSIRLIVASLIVASIALGWALLWPPSSPEPSGRVPIAVVGDSDSHGYDDEVLGVVRGGSYAPVTYQWTEVLARLRPTEVDFGPTGPWGQNRVVARLRALLGWPARVPRKDDFRYNFALSGARCATLSSAWPQQGRWLLSLLRSAPSRWRDGVVVVKIGVNDAGQVEHLRRYASGASIVEAADRCAAEVDGLLTAIRGVSPVAVVVVGIADDSSWPASEVPEWSDAEVSRIRAELDAFDAALRRVTLRFERTTFMNDRDWYYDHWPDRGSDGASRTGGVSLGGSVEVTNTRGDAPDNLMLSDGHAGTVANGFWAMKLVRTLNLAFGLGLAPPSPAEVGRLVDPDGRRGLASRDSIGG